MPNTNTEYPQCTAYDTSRCTNLKKLWMSLKRTRLFYAIRHSRLNPYHTFVSKTDIQDLNQAKLVARMQNRGFILYNKTRYSTNPDCSINEEFKRYGNVIRDGIDVTDRLPRNKNNEIDLTAEEPIVLAIVPIEGPSKTGHVCMQYQDKVINRVREKIRNEPLFSIYGKHADYYFVYPSHLGINPKDLIAEMEKTTITKGGKYNLFTNNCAGSVDTVFKNLGVHINFLGLNRLKLRLPTPGNNPFGFGIRNWCRKNGVKIRHEEMLHLYKYNGWTPQSRALFAQLNKSSR